MGIRFTLLTRYPCCDGPVKFMATKFVPREQWTARCPVCKKTWDVERRSVREDGGKRVDILEWTPELTPDPK